MSFMVEEGLRHVCYLDQIPTIFSRVPTPLKMVLSILQVILWS